MKLTLSGEEVKVFNPINLYIKLETEEEAKNFAYFLSPEDSGMKEYIRVKLFSEWFRFLPKIN